MDENKEKDVQENNEVVHEETNKTETKQEETEKAEKQSEVKEKKNKKSKAPIIVTVIILIVLIIAVVGYFIWQNIKKNETVGTTWGDTYYAFLKAGMESESKEMKEDFYGIHDNMEDVTLQFIDIEENAAPVMIMNYKEEGDNYVNVYNIQGEQNVYNRIVSEPSDVELLYNISLDKYIWYIHIDKENSDVYSPITLGETTMTNSTQENNNTITENSNNIANNNIVNENTVNNTTSENLVSAGTPEEITIEKGEETVQETVDGDKITISKFDETFVKPEVEESTQISVDLNNIDGLKETMEETVNGYKQEEDIVTEEVKTEVTGQVEKIESIQQDIKDAQEEIKEKEAEEKRKAEEAKKKAEEEARNAGAKAGSYTLKYGTYTPDIEGPAAGEYTINSDGTFTYKNNWENVNGEKYTDTGSGTYRVYYSEGDLYDDTQCWVISFSYTKYHSTYEPSNELPINNNDIVFDITGNNKFQYRQSIGTWTLD